MLGGLIGVAGMIVCTQVKRIHTCFCIFCILPVFHVSFVLEELQKGEAVKKNKINARQHFYGISSEICVPAAK